MVVRVLGAVFQKIVTLTVDSVSRQKKMYVDYNPCFVLLTVDGNESICLNAVQRKRISHLLHNSVKNSAIVSTCIDIIDKEKINLDTRAHLDDLSISRVTLKFLVFSESSQEYDKF